jgi:hypothetical protein
MENQSEPIKMEGCLCSKAEGAKQLASPGCTAFLVLTESEDGKLVFTNMPPPVAKKLGELLGVELNGRSIKINFQDDLN